MKRGTAAAEEEKAYKLLKVICMYVSNLSNANAKCVVLC
jgi:hypothetical protein